MKLKDQSVREREIRKCSGHHTVATQDLLAVEEPLEIRLSYSSAGNRAVKCISVTMRTPGADADLAAGFLFTEGIVHRAAELESIGEIAPAGNVITIALQEGVGFDPEKLDRHFYTTSSCGVCGKTSIEALKTAVPCAAPSNQAGPAIDPALIYTLPDTLRRAQDTFDATGGLHAAALFDLAGNLLAIREDVGRHNALDKLIGHFFLQNNVPLDRHILLLSGRASFELIQKAAMAGIRVVCAVGAPSSLAVETAESFGITLVGFLRDNRFNIYSGFSDLSFTNNTHL